MKSFKLALLMALGLLAGVRGARAQPTPTISISLIAPTLAELSWPSNFAGWQLLSSTNPGLSATWQAVPGTPLPLGNAFVMFSALTNSSLFFRLQLGGGGGGGGTFQATPPVISPGGSSTLSWRVDPNTTYQLLPGPGPVTGSNYVVSPTVTTVYSLIASNFFTFTFTSQQTTVTVATASCDFASAKGWDCTLNFSYPFTASSSSYLFNIHQQGSLTFHLSPSSVTAHSATFGGTVGGNAQINDLEDALTIAPPDNITTLIGSATPDAGSPLGLEINCTSGTYTFYVSPVISATLAHGNGGQTSLHWVGTVEIMNRTLPTSFGPLTSTGTESLPTHSLLWSGTGDAYLTAELGSVMIYSGTATDTTAGSASVSWTFTPSP
jgi:hypothetical protein